MEASSKMTMRAPHKIFNAEVWVNGDKTVEIVSGVVGARGIDVQDVIEKGI